MHHAPAKHLTRTYTRVGVPTRVRFNAFTRVNKPGITASAVGVHRANETAEPIVTMLSVEHSGKKREDLLLRESRSYHSMWKQLILASRRN